MKVWITKYALSQGIYEVEGEESVYVEGMFSAFNPLGAFTKGHWHKTREAAVDKAEHMRAAKIRSLAKQLNRLEHLIFAEEAV